ncbi:MAG: hypothetical protein K2M04_04115, partial [Muribaculaceae bacterium]|nr:hypothetical protein [Muribaculaceae bacterium]
RHPSSGRGLVVVYKRQKRHDPAADDSLLSESLAKIYIRQHDYVRAYEIIERLNLNFPEKSIYFADQLRFLRKIIDIQSKKSSKA